MLLSVNSCIYFDNHIPVEHSFIFFIIHFLTVSKKRLEDDKDKCVLWCLNVKLRELYNECMRIRCCCHDEFVMSKMLRCFWYSQLWGAPCVDRQDLQTQNTGRYCSHKVSLKHTVHYESSNKKKHFFLLSCGLLCANWQRLINANLFNMLTESWKLTSYYCYCYCYCYCNCYCYYW